MSNATSSIQVCYDGDVTSTSTTGTAWSVTVDTTVAPWNGDSTLTHYSGWNDGYTVTISGTTITISGGYDLNTQVSSTKSQHVRLCNYSLSPVPPTAGTVTITTAQSTTWTTTSACLRVTATSISSYPWYFAWQGTLDMSTAFARIGAGNVTSVRADGIPVNFSPSLSASVISYTMSSQTPSAVKAGTPYQFNVCAYHNA